MWLYVLIIVLVLLAVGIQVLYLRTYAAQAGPATKVVIYINVTLLLLVAATVAWFALRAGGN